MSDGAGDGKRRSENLPGENGETTAADARVASVGRRGGGGGVTVMRSFVEFSADNEVTDSPGTRCVHWQGLLLLLETVRLPVLELFAFE